MSRPHDEAAATAARGLSDRNRVDGPMVSDAVGSAKKVILDYPYVTSEEITGLLAGRPSPADLARLRRHGNVLGLRFAHRGYLYPSFQFDMSVARIHPLVSKVNRLILREYSVADALLWWLRPHHPTPRPMDLLTSGSTESLLQLARDVNADHSSLPLRD